jgi:cyclic nucleotide-binding protein
MTDPITDATTDLIKKDLAAQSRILTPALTRALLISAQVLALIVFIMALEFLRQTTGGTLFLFATIAPVLAMLAAIVVLGIALYGFLRRHSLFDIKDVKAGKVIFRQGEEGDCAYFIHSGEVEVVRREDGTDRVMDRLKKGQYFGEMALISNAPRNATVRSVTPVRVAILGKQNFLTMISLMPHTQEDIMQTIHMRAMSKAEE